MSHPKEFLGICDRCHRHRPCLMVPYETPPEVFAVLPPTEIIVGDGYIEERPVMEEPRIMAAAMCEECRFYKLKFGGCRKAEELGTCAPSYRNMVERLTVVDEFAGLWGAAPPGFSFTFKAHAPEWLKAFYGEGDDKKLSECQERDEDEPR